MTLSEKMEKLMESVPKDIKNWDHSKVILYKLSLTRASRLVQKYEEGRNVNTVMVEEAIKHLSGFYD